METDAHWYNDLAVALQLERLVAIQFAMLFFSSIATLSLLYPNFNMPTLNAPMTLNNCQ